MTNPQPKNIAASVHRRLLNKAKEADRSFNELFQYYAIERFLYRLSLSTHAERFVLKGALMLMVWESPLFRSTMDIDVLGRLENSIDNIITIVQEVCRQEAVPDGIIFDPQSVQGQRITEDADYEGFASASVVLWLQRASAFRWTSVSGMLCSQRRNLKSIRRSSICRHRAFAATAWRVPWRRSLKPWSSWAS